MSTNAQMSNLFEKFLATASKVAKKESESITSQIVLYMASEECKRMALENLERIFERSFHDINEEDDTDEIEPTTDTDKKVEEEPVLTDDSESKDEPIVKPEAMPESNETPQKKVKKEKKQKVKKVTPISSPSIGELVQPVHSECVDENEIIQEESPNEIKPKKEKKTKKQSSESSIEEDKPKLKSKKEKKVKNEVVSSSQPEEPQTQETEELTEEDLIDIVIEENDE